MLIVPSAQLNENGCNWPDWQAFEFATPLMVTVLPFVTGEEIASWGGTSAVEPVRSTVVEVVALNPFVSVAITCTR